MVTLVHHLLSLGGEICGWYNYIIGGYPFRGTRFFCHSSPYISDFPDYWEYPTLTWRRIFTFTNSPSYYHFNGYEI